MSIITIKYFNDYTGSMFLHVSFNYRMAMKYVLLEMKHLENYLKLIQMLIS